MELFDILDVHGTLTGRTAEKGHQCAEGEYYLGVHVYIYNSDHEFLLQKRASDKKFLPDTWETLLEHAIVSESGVAAARRGVLEELGLSFREEDFQLLYRMVWEEYHHLVDVFFLKADLDIDQIHFQEEELTALKWVTKEEMLHFVLQMENYRPKEYINHLYAHIAGL